MTDSATLQAAITKIDTDAGLFHDIVHGAADATVQTEGGAVDTVAKAIAAIASNIPDGGKFQGKITAGTDYGANDYIIADNALWRVKQDYTHQANAAVVEGADFEKVLSGSTAFDSSDIEEDIAGNAEDIDSLQNDVSILRDEVRNSPGVLTRTQQDFLNRYTEGVEAEAVDPAALAEYTHAFDFVSVDAGENPWTAAGVNVNGQEVSGLSASWDKVIGIQVDIPAAGTQLGEKIIKSMAHNNVGVSLVKLVPVAGDTSRWSIAVNDWTPPHAGTEEVWHSYTTHPNGYTLRRIDNGANGELRWQLVNYFPANTVKDGTAGSEVDLDIQVHIPGNFRADVGHSFSVNIPLVNDEEGDAGATGLDNVTITNATEDITYWGNTIGTANVRIYPGTDGVPIVELTSVVFTAAATRDGWVINEAACQAHQSFSYNTPEQVAARDHWVWITGTDGDIELDQDLIGKAAIVFQFESLPDGSYEIVPVVRELEPIGNHTAVVHQCNNTNIHWSLFGAAGDATVLAFRDWANRAQTDSSIKPLGFHKTGDVAHYISHSNLAARVRDHWGEKYCIAFLELLTVQHAGITGRFDFENNKLFVGDHSLGVNAQKKLLIDGEVFAGGGGGGGDAREITNLTTQLSAGVATITLPNEKTLDDFSSIQLRVTFTPHDLGLRAFARTLTISIPIQATFGGQHAYVPIGMRGAFFYVAEIFGWDVVNNLPQNMFNGDQTVFRVQIRDANSDNTTIPITEVHKAVGLPL